MAAKAVQAGNEQYAQGYKPPPFMFEPTKNPAKKAAVITCLDSRLDPQAFLGAELGDYHIIRNAGGRINNDVIDNLVVSQQLLGTREVFVVHHTRCGMLAFNSKDFNEKLKSAGVDVGNKDWREFSEGLEQSVKEDVAALKASPLIPDDIVVHGYIYHIEDGKLEPLAC